MRRATQTAHVGFNGETRTIVKDFEYADNDPIVAAYPHLFAPQDRVAVNVDSGVEVAKAVRAAVKRGGRRATS